MAIIGGGFGSGIHNIGEALVYGMPVVFGPNYQKFNEAVDSIDLKFGYSFKNEQELFGILTHLLQNQDQLNQLKINARNYIHQNSGSTKKIINYLVKNNYLN
jgi:3-deoxy-D-manno-octulosonic-acid transferase